MGQTRRQSLIEAGTNIAVGLLVSYVANMAFLSAIGMPISHGQNAVLAVFMTVISLIRSYTLRRLFNRWHR